MEPHSHPGYEQTFARIATILDVLAQEQLGQERAITALAANAQERDQAHTRLENAMADLALKSAGTEGKLNALIDLMDRHLREHNKRDK